MTDAQNPRQIGGGRRTLGEFSPKLAELTDDVRHDTVFLPFHFADLESANVLTEAATDPISGMPEFKKTSVRVTAVHEGAT